MSVAVLRAVWAPRVVTLGLLGLVLALTAPRRALAADSDQRAEAALQVAEAGVKLYKLKQYREALDFFLKSYELKPLPDVVWNIGRCYEELREPARALRFFEESAETDPSAENRKKAKAKVQHIMTLYYAQVAFVTEPPGARVEVDGQKLGESPVEGRVLPTGRHDLKVSLAGYETVEQRIRVSSGEANRFKVSLTLASSRIRIDAGKEVFGARVSIDGAYKGTFPLPTTLDIRPGTHLVEVKGVLGFDDLRQDVEVKAGETKVLKLAQ